MILLILSSIFICFTLYYLTLLFTRTVLQPRYGPQNLILPPGPFAWPLIGNYLGKNRLTVYRNVLQNLVPKYGPVISMWWGTKPIIFINDYKLANEALGQEHGRKLAGRHSSYMDTIVSEGNNNVFDNNYGPKWMEMIKNIKDAIIKCALVPNTEVYIQKSIDKYMIELMSKPENSTKGVHPFDESYWLSDNIILIVFIGQIFDYSDEEYKTLYSSRKDVFDVLDNADFANWIPFAQHLPIPSVLKVKRQSTKLDNLLTSFIRKVRSEGSYKTNPTNVCGYLWNVIEEAEKAEKNKALLKEVNIRQIFKDMLFASYEGIGLTNVWFMALLALNPKIQQNIRDQLTKLSRDKNDSVPRLSWRDELPYVQAVEFEFFRYSSIVGILDFHYALDDVQIGNGKYNLPKGSYIAINQYSINHSPDLFDKPEAIVPERFINEEGKFFDRKELITFGLGVRMCPGTVVTKAYCFLLLCNICMSYKLEWTDANDADCLIDDTEESGLFRYPLEYFVKISKL